MNTPYHQLLDLRISSGNGLILLGLQALFHRPLIARNVVAQRPERDRQVKIWVKVLPPYG